MKIPFYIFLLIFTTSCVSSKLYDAVRSENNALKLENRGLMAQLDSLSKGSTINSEKLAAQLAKTQAEKSQLQMQLDALKNTLAELQTSYDALEANSSKNLAQNLTQNRALLKQLEEKEKQLAKESERLTKLESDLALREQRINELESVIAAKDAKMESLKTAISKALVDFEGKGLTVENRNGKVYVSMENKLLFKSGSWDINEQGKKAVEQLGKVLSQNPDIAVLIEGHTDNVPYSGNGNVQNNWDLSTKRATTIVSILSQNPNVIKSNLTAAGRGEFSPIASNDTPEGRAQNRRIEVILSPKWDKISKLLSAD
jgi:chemotaxis protein MotB